MPRRSLPSKKRKLIRSPVRFENQAQPSADWEKSSILICEMAKANEQDQCSGVAQWGQNSKIETIFNLRYIVFKNIETGISKFLSNVSIKNNFMYFEKRSLTKQHQAADQIHGKPFRCAKIKDLCLLYKKLWMPVGLSIRFSSHLSRNHPFKMLAFFRGGGVKNLPNLPTYSSKKLPTVGG